MNTSILGEEGPSKQGLEIVVEPQGKSHEDAVDWLKQTIQGTKGSPLAIDASIAGIEVEILIKGGVGVDALLDHLSS